MQCFEKQGYLAYHPSMSDDDKPEASTNANHPQQDIGLMIQRRALYRLQRESEKPPRSPKRIIMVSLAVLVTMSLLLLLVDRSVRVMHRVMDIWVPVILDVKKPAQQSSSSSSSMTSIDPSVPYMIRVEPGASQNAQSSTQRAPK